jgi:repressor LexA
MLLIVALDLRGGYMENLKIARKMRGLSQEEVAKYLGMSRQGYGSYETGFRDPDTITLSKLATVFDVTTDFLLGVTRNPTEDPHSHLIPVLGEVPAGHPIEAFEQVEEYIDYSPTFVQHGELFALRVKGKSMEPNILSGDIAVVLKQDYCDSGDVAVVRVNAILLIPCNQSFETVFFTNEQIQQLPVTIIGKIIEIRRRL